MRVVLDTNIVLSGVFFGEVPGEILAVWSRGRFDVVVSAAILAEYRRAGEALASGKPRLVAVWRPVKAWIARHADLVDADVTLESVRADRDDDVFLACALAGGAGFIVSGDRHLKDVSGWRGISVPFPRRFLDEVLGGHPPPGDASGRAHDGSNRATAVPANTPYGQLLGRGSARDDVG